MLIFQKTKGFLLLSEVALGTMYKAYDSNDRKKNKEQEYPMKDSNSTKAVGKKGVSPLSSLFPFFINFFLPFFPSL